MTTALPTVGFDGALVANAGKYARNIVLSVVEMKGGAAGLLEWANRNAVNESDFWTKLFPKVIQREVEVNDKRSIEDVLQALDGEFTVVENPVPAAGPVAVDFSSFGSDIVLGVDEVAEVSDD